MTTTYLPASFSEATMAIAEGKHVEFKLANGPEAKWHSFMEDRWFRLADAPKYIWRIRAQDEQAQTIEQMQAELGLLRSERDYMLQRIGDLEIELRTARANGIRAIRFFGG